MAGHPHIVIEDRRTHHGHSGGAVPGTGTNDERLARAERAGLLILVTKVHPAELSSSNEGDGSVSDRELSTAPPIKASGTGVKVVYQAARQHPGGVWS